jgi:hypothetical protein
MGFVVDKVALWQVFCEYFGFPCQFTFHRLLHTHLSSGAGTTGQIVADVPSGLISPHPKNLTKLRAILIFSHVVWKAELSKVENSYCQATDTTKLLSAVL